MPNQVMCIERLASIQFEGSDPSFKPGTGDKLSHKYKTQLIVVRAVIGLRPLANRLAGATCRPVAY